MIPLWEIEGLILRVVLGAALAGIACSLIGTFVVRMKLSSIGFCMSHAAFAGAALGILIACDPLLCAMIFSVMTAFFLGPVTDKAKLHSDTIIGIAFSLTIALGMLFLSFAPGSVITSAALGVLWGSIFGLTNDNITKLAILTVAIILMVILFSKEFRAIMFDRKMAEESGINTKHFHYLILFLTGITVSLSLNLVGGLLIFALIVNPTSAAYQFCYDMKKIIILSPVFGVAGCMAGLLMSFEFDFPVGASIAIAVSLLFVFSVILSPKRRRG
jgi:ABC-type Mn2+/Zn2+ transport system permease subunit